MAFLPPNLDVPPYFAEKAAVQFVRHFLAACPPPPDNRWLYRIWQQLQQQRGLVARTLGCRKGDYIARLKAEVDSDGHGPANAIPKALANAPNHLWLTEVSLPDLYTANKHKLGDLLTDAKANVRGAQKMLNYVWGWLPGVQVPINPHPGTAPPSWLYTGHIPIFRPGKVLGPHVEW
jgi:hypothetical protein